MIYLGIFLLILFSIQLIFLLIRWSFLNIFKIILGIANKKEKKKTKIKRNKINNNYKDYKNDNKTTKIAEDVKIKTVEDTD